MVFNIAILGGLFSLFFTRVLGRWRSSSILLETGEVQMLLLPKELPEEEQSAKWLAALDPKILFLYSKY